MADAVITLDDYKASSPSARKAVTNDNLKSLMEAEGIAYDPNANKADMLDALDAHITANGGDNADDKAGAQSDASATWGAPPASGNGAHTADTIPPAAAVGGTPVEGDAPGQGRVVAPSADHVPADTLPAAAHQAEPNTPDHHDASADGQGPGGTTLDPEVAKRTGAAIADPDDRASPSDDYLNAIARRTADFDPSHVGEGKPGDDNVVVPDGVIPHTELLRAANEIDANIAASKAPPVNPNAVKPVFAEPATEFVIPPHPNEKLTDAIGSTHDAAGNVVAPGAAGPGVPVYVGTAQPVENPDAQWRANTAG